MKAISRFSAKYFKQIGSYFTHVLEHARAMPGDRLRIRRCSELNPEQFGHLKKNVENSTKRKQGDRFLREVNLNLRGRRYRESDRCAWGSRRTRRGDRP